MLKKVFCKIAALLRRVKPYLDVDTFVLYKALVQPYFDYGSVACMVVLKKIMLNLMLYRNDVHG